MATKYQYYVQRWALAVAKQIGASRILDLGSGPGFKADWFRQKGYDVTLIDQPTVEPVVRRFFPEARFIGMDISSPHDALDERFELIVCADVLEHLERPDKCLHFIRKHLTNSGFVLLSTPERDIRRGLGCLQSDNLEHIREWNKNEFQQFVKNEGFLVQKLRLLPLKHLSQLEYTISRLLSPCLITSRWSCCQAILAKKSEENI